MIAAAGWMADFVAAKAMTMTTNQNNSENPENFEGQFSGEADRLLSSDDVDLLISRTVDGSASATEWVLLQGHALRTPGVWMDLATTYRDAQLIEQRVGQATRTAEHVVLPDANDVRVARHDSHPGGAARRAHGFTFARAAAWGGWAAAAVLTLAMISRSMVESPAMPSGSPNKMNTAGIDMGVGDLLDSYLKKGKEEGVVMGELPEKQILGTIPQDDGSVEVVYARLIVERASVDRFYRSTMNEAGVRQGVPIRITTTTAPTPTRRAVREVY
ncbi:MAG: hypothetical protein U0640_04770 [Phycisphaerales bacterium]